MSIFTGTCIIIGALIIGIPLRKVNNTLNKVNSHVKELNEFFNRKKVI